MKSSHIPLVSYTILAIVLILWGLLNIVNALSDPSAFEGTTNPPSLFKGILYLVGGLGYFVTRIVLKYRNKKS
jgi:hypothetical protein